MNKLFPLLLFIFSLISYGQENKPFDVQNAYLNELLSSYEDKSFSSFDSDNIEWRTKTVEKLTSKSNLQKSSFLKTAMVLHMLKYKIGDATFSKAISSYKNNLVKKDKKADLLDFQHHLENLSGIELTRFFNDWFKSKGHPSYEIAWFQNEQTFETSFTVKQKQSDKSVSFFELPVPINLVGEDDESQLVRLELSKNGQTFNAIIPFKINEVQIDPEHQLISKDNVAKIGIDQEILNKEISLYPNPAVNDITVLNDSEAVVEKVSIYNMLGKLIVEELNPLNAISLKDLSNGMHLVKIETSQGTLHKTILKK